MKEKRRWPKTMNYLQSKSNRLKKLKTIWFRTISNMRTSWMS